MPSREAMDIDDVVVERLVAGEPVMGANRAERWRAVLALSARGWAERRIATWLGLKPWHVAWYVAATKQAVASESACAGPDCPYCRRRARERMGAKDAARREA